jgi:hypothetical protein
MKEVNGKWVMKDIKEDMYKGKSDDCPDNLLHCFNVRTWDFGISDDIAKE